VYSRKKRLQRLELTPPSLGVVELQQEQPGGIHRPRLEQIVRCVHVADTAAPFQRRVPFALHVPGRHQRHLPLQLRASGVGAHQDVDEIVIEAVERGGTVHTPRDER